MIIYGTNSKLLKQAPLENQACDHCNEKAVFLSIYSSYVHVFWIPIFPYRKKALLQCSHCQKVTKEKEVPNDKRETFKALKSSVSTPKYLYAGLAIIILAVASIAYLGGKSKEAELAYLESPAVGDVYKLKDETEVTEYKYYLWKIVGVGDDSLQIASSAFSYNGLPTKMEAEDGFYDAYFMVDRALVKEMYEKSEIRSIVRGYGDHTGFNQTVTYVNDSTAQSE